MNAAPTRRYRLRRAIERGDPRLGLIVGVAVSLLVSWAFVRRDLVTPADRLELLMLDLAFMGRAPIRESEKILLADMDDNSLKKLDWPLDRKYYAQAALALDRLGARQIVFDVEFKMVVPRQGEFDEETGEYRLTPSERALRFAIGTSQKVTLAYHVDPRDPIPQEVLPFVPKFRELLAKSPGASEEEVVKATGVPAPLIRDRLEGIREQVVMALVAELLDRRPDLPFLELRKIFLPRYSPRLHGADLALLQFSYWHWKCLKEMERKTALPRGDQAPPKLFRWRSVLPPFHPFLDHAQGVGCVNAEPDPDGVMRRPWTHLPVGDRYFPYLGLQAAIRDLEMGGEKVETAIGPRSLEIRRSGGTIVLPLDEEGRLLVNWAGNSRRRRGKKEDYYAHIPFLHLISFFQSRYEKLDENFRSMILQIPEEERPAAHREYLRLSSLLAGAMSGDSELPFEEGRKIDAKLDRIRLKLLADMESDIAALDAEIPKMGEKKRLQERMKEQRDKLALQRDGLREPYDLERRLRPLVEGRICVIGSASTASGDLPPTPLGTIPGMDVVVNVTNMVLTQQVIRSVPGGVNFAFMFAAGVLVALIVTHGNTTGSALATLAVAGASIGVFGLLFTGPAILVSGAGPPFTAAMSFAAVTAFKELLTQRSKRKLQRELEKNTSAELVKILMEHPEFLSVPRKMTGTFFFSDVKSFTSMSEKMHADVLFPFINRYLDRMTQNLKAQQAYVDKYIGDGIMALFGIPVPTPEHARLACQAALDCQAGLKPLNAEFKLEGLPEVKVRIGIHSGEVSAGNVGALDRSNYTVLGDNVNLAARLEGANKQYDTSIMISEATWDLVSGRFVARELDRIRVVGKRKPVTIFELVAAAGEALPVRSEFLESYAAALALFKDRLWPESIDAFQKALELKPGDRPCEIYIERAKVFQEMPPPPDWEGVFELTSK